LGHVGADEGVVRQLGGDALEDGLVDRLQRAVAGLHGAAQCATAALAAAASRTLSGRRSSSRHGLPGVAVQRHGAGVEVVELARVDVHPQQLAVERQALAPEVGVGHFGADRQHHIGLGDQVPAGLDAQAGAGIERRVRWRQALAGDAGEQRRGQALAQQLQLGGSARHHPAMIIGRLAPPVCGRLLHACGRRAAPGAAHHLIAPVASDGRRSTSSGTEICTGRGRSLSNTA
jgi:hypothetical protein